MRSNQGSSSREGNLELTFLPPCTCILDTNSSRNSEVIHAGICEFFSQSQTCPTRVLEGREVGEEESSRAHTFPPFLVVVFPDYPPDSLKTRFCTRGRKLLYERCERMSIPFKKTGKVRALSFERQLLHSALALVLILPSLSIPSARPRYKVQAANLLRRPTLHAHPTPSRQRPFVASYRRRVQMDGASTL